MVTSRVVRGWLLTATLAAGSTGCASAGGASRPSPFPTAPAPPESPRPAATRPAARPAIASVVETAMSLRGAPYRMGGESPRTGFDCSGFVQYVFGQRHIDVPRTVGDQYRSGLPVSILEVRAGDLVFFSTTGPGASHVGIAVGDTGEFIHAPSERGVVRVERLDSPYWHNRFVGARRVGDGSVFHRIEHFGDRSPQVSRGSSPENSLEPAGHPLSETWSDLSPKRLLLWKSDPSPISFP